MALLVIRGVGLVHSSMIGPRPLTFPPNVRPAQPAGAWAEVWRRVDREEKPT